MTLPLWSPLPLQETTDSRLQLFAMKGSDALGAAIAETLGCPLSVHEERDFEDGEYKIRPLETVTGSDVYVVHSLHGGPVESPNDKLCQLLLFFGALMLEPRRLPRSSRIFAMRARTGARRAMIQ